MVTFSKYCGAGNDFILIDNREKTFSLSDLLLARMVSQLCNRFYGIGGDGIIFLEASKACDFGMRIYNSDGSQAEMCGNGLRCLGRFIQDLGINKKKFFVETPLSFQKSHYVEVAEQMVTIEMGTPNEIKHIELPDLNLNALFLNTGVPHAVIFSENIKEISVKNLGSHIRNLPCFQPKGTNVNFVQIMENFLSLRTYERGVENETLACGTGAVAAALAAAKKYHFPSPIHVKVQSQENLIIHFETNKDFFTRVLMSGPANRIFQGKFNIEDFLSP